MPIKFEQFSALKEGTKRLSPLHMPTPTLSFQDVHCWTWLLELDSGNPAIPLLVYIQRKP